PTPFSHCRSPPPPCDVIASLFCTSLPLSAIYSLSLHDALPICIGFKLTLFLNHYNQGHTVLIPEQRVDRLTPVPRKLPNRRCRRRSNRLPSSTRRRRLRRNSNRCLMRRSRPDFRRRSRCSTRRSCPFRPKKSMSSHRSTRRLSPDRSVLRSWCLLTRPHPPRWPLPRSCSFPYSRCPGSSRCPTGNRSRRSPSPRIPR